MKKRKSLITILAFVLIIITTFSYSALSTRFQIVSDVVFRVDADIRVNDISLDSTSNGGLISFDSNYTKNTITSGFKLPNLNSSISYNVTITNKGNIDQAIYDLTTFSTSNDNIYYLVDDMPLNEALPMIVPFGTSKTIKITYKTTSPFTQTETIVNSFVFKKVYYVDYNLKGGSYTNDQNDLKNGQIKYEDVDLTLTNEKPIKNKYAFIGWTDEQNGTTVKYPSGSTYSLNKNIILYAVYRQGEATFLPGADFNAKIKQLANPNVQNIDINYDDTNITSIVRANTLPNGFTPTSDNVVSTSTSDFPIYAWYNNGTIYWYSDVDNPYMNAYANNMFRSLSGVTSIDISTINTSRTKSMHAMFMSCNSLSSLDLSNFDTSLVGTSAYASTGMTYMFYGCSSLTTLNLSTFNTSNVTSMAYMFFGCTNLQSVTFGNDFDTSNVAYMAYMFANCPSLSSIDLSSFDTSELISMNSMFFNCSSLTSLNFSSFNTSKVESMRGLVNNCSSLTSIIFGNNFDTSRVTDMEYMFQNCTSLTSLNLTDFDTQNVEIMQYMFTNCVNLTSLDLSNFSMESATTVTNMLANLSSLTSLKTPNTYPSNLIIDLPKALYDVNGNEYTTLVTGNPTETWLKLAYTVSFNSNGGTGTMNDQKVQYNTSTNLNTNTFTRTNYTFAGWNTKADGTGTAYLDGASVNALASANETISLYAQWAGIPYTVTFNTNGGNINKFEGNELNILAAGVDSYSISNNVYTITTSTAYPSIMLPLDIFTNGKTYTLKYKFKKNSGTLYTLGGHCQSTSKIYLKVDGQTTSSSYNQINMSDDNLIHEIEYKFVFSSGNGGVYIQPNRGYASLINYDLWDIEVIEDNYVATKTVYYDSTYGTLPTPTRTGYTFTGWSVNILPSQYQVVEYIKKDTLYIGDNDNLGEYINTGITINRSNYNSIRFVVDEALDETDTTQGWYLNGAAKNGIDAIYVGIYKNKFVYGVGRDLNSNVSIANMSDRYRHDLNIKNNSYKVYDESNNLLVDISISKYTGFTTQGLPLYLMAYSGENRGHAGRLYGAEIYIDDVLVRKFIPCYRKSDNVAGLYDIVTNEFYTNAGTGTFIIGNSINGEYVYNSTLVTKTENHTLTAIWEPNNYEIVFDKNSNDATGTMSNQSMTYDESKVLTTNTFTRDGYTFVGWNTKADGTGTAYLDGASVSNVASSGTVTLYAQWAVISYTVTLDSNEGNIIDNVNLLSYETSMERNNDQYIVSGTTNTAGIYVPSEAFEGGKTYILRFKIQKVDGSLTALGGHLAHTQIYFKIDGSNSSSRYTDYYSTTNNIPNDTNVHTVELKFTYNGSTSGVDRNIYIQPNRAKTDYFKVKIFDVELEELSTTKTVNFGSTYGTLPTPTTPGYQFAGWNGKNLFEVGTIDDYYIYYQPGMNVSISNNTISSTILEGQMAFIINEKHTYNAGDYVFKYQSSNNYKRHLICPYDENGNILTDSDISISGWTYNQYYHGWFSNLLDLEYSTATIPEEVSYWKYGIVFIGAISEFGDTLEVSNIMIEEGTESTAFEPYYVTSSTLLTQNKDHTLTARWTPNTYSVAFDKNDTNATGTMNNQSMTYGTSSNLTNNSYYKRGYKFVGWNTASDGTGTAYLNGASVSNLTNVNNGTVTLYAQWEKLMAEDIGHTIQDLNCEDVQCVIDELYYMLY